MKLVAPISKIYEVEDVIQAGADELYCGVYTKEWQQKYTDIASPNRHPGRSANLDDFKELNRVVKLAHSHNIPVFFTINEFYSEGQYNLALDDSERAIDAGVDGLIVVDINLLLMIKDRGHNIKIHMGTGATTFNSQTVAFYKNLGVSRVILDRQLSIEEIGLITRKSPEIELEVFVFNQKCHNIDGFCTFAHGLMATKYPFLSRVWNVKFVRKFLNSHPDSTSWLQKAIFRKELGCCLNYEISDGGLKLKAEKRTGLLGSFDAEHFLHRCGACALYDLNKFKIGFVKVVGREDFTAKKIRDIKFIHSSLDLLKDNSGKQDFKEEIKALYSNIYSSNCESGLCYYPT